MVKHTCCFIGHRFLPEDIIDNLKTPLDYAIDKLYYQGVENFISGGTLGFAQMVASLIIDKKSAGYNIRLIFMLPYRNHGNLWTKKQRKKYNSLLMNADEIQYVSDEYYEGCMEKRNLDMINRSNYLICALNQGKSEKSCYINHAQINGLLVINLMC